LKRLCISLPSWL
jgi:hypothetical protein